MSRSGGEWKRLKEVKYWADKPSWSPDGKTLYFISNHRTAFFNVGGIRFDPVDGKATSEPFQVTSFESPGKMISTQIIDTKISLSKDGLVVPIREVTGSIWMLENVDR